MVTAKQLTEYEAFQRLTTGLDIAIDGAVLVSRHRDDMRDGWLIIAKTLEVTKESVMRLAGEGTVKGKH